MTIRYATLSVLSCWLLAATVASSQVTFEPGRLFLSDTNSIKTLVVTNPATVDKVVEIVPRFGHPTTDSLGRMVMMYPDTSKRHDNDASALLDIVPRRFVLKAKAKQDVIFSPRQSHVPDFGMYWTRVAIRSYDVRERALVEHDTSPEMNDCMADVPLWYVHGTADVRLAERKLVSFIGPAGRHRFLVETGPEGEAPFIGTLGVVLMHNSQVVSNNTYMINLYRHERTLLFPPDPNIKPGDYEIQLYWTLGRKNIIPAYSTSYQTQVDRFTFTVQPNGNITID